MQNIIKVKEFDQPVEIDKKAMKKYGIDTSEIFIIYAGKTYKNLLKTLIETAEYSGTNIIAFASEGAVVAGPSISKIVSILKNKK